jgi:hypothetical protein
MKSDAAFVWPQSAIELDAEAAVNLEFALVILPGDAEDYLSFWFDKAVEDFGLDIFRMLVEDRLETVQYFLYGLMELCFARITFENLFINRLDNAVRFHLSDLLTFVFLQ